MESMYADGTYFRNNPDWHQHESCWKADKVIEVIRRNNLSPTSICDLGCGAGEVLRLLSERVPGDIPCTGYDISPQAYELCAREGWEESQLPLSRLARGGCHV